MCEASLVNEWEASGDVEEVVSLITGEKLVMSLILPQWLED